MTVQLERLATLGQEDAVLPVGLTPEHAETFTWLESSFSDEDEDRILDVLFEHNPVGTLKGNIKYLEELYSGRIVNRQLQDGSILSSWGTRDEAAQYLTHRYYVHRQADGSTTYRALTLSEAGRRLFELNDKNEGVVTHIPKAKHARDFAPYRPKQLEHDATIAAMKDLSRASRVSSRILAERGEVATASANSSAAGMLASGPLEPLLQRTNDTYDIDLIFEQYVADKQVPYELLRVPLFRSIVALG